MRPQAPSSLVFLCLHLAVLADSPMREAPAMTAVPVNQLRVSGNACGPAALLNSFRFGAPHWQKIAGSVAGDDDRERILTIIREIGMRPSKHLPGRARWSRKGVGLADLRDMGNEMIMGHALPRLGEEVFYLKPGETPEKLLARAHKRFETSLAKGFPPVVSLRRLVLREQAGKPDQWTAVDAHFVTLTAVPRRLHGKARSFAVRYIDPWGGHHREGMVRIPEIQLLEDTKGMSSALEAVFPETKVGMEKTGRGQVTALVPSAAIGRW